MGQGHLECLYNVNKMESKVLKTSKVVMKNQTPVVIYNDTKSPNFYNNDPRSFKQIPL